MQSDIATVAVPAQRGGDLCRVGRRARTLVRGRDSGDSSVCAPDLCTNTFRKFADTIRTSGRHDDLDIDIGRPCSLCLIYCTSTATPRPLAMVHTFPAAFMDHHSFLRHRSCDSWSNPLH
jgi:hypothetical protein